MVAVSALNTSWLKISHPVVKTHQFVTVRMKESLQNRVPHIILAPAKHELWNKCYKAAVVRLHSLKSDGVNQ